MIEWEDRFSVGNMQVDAEHKTLLGMLSTLQELSISASEGIDVYDDIIEAIDALRNYTVVHFKNEEELFKNTGYSDEGVHIFQHKLFIKKIQAIDISAIDHRQLDFIKQLVSELLEWVLNHVLHVDMGYKSYIQSLQTNE